MASVKNPAGSGNNLPTTAMDGISVQGHIVNVKTDTSHILVAQSALKVDKKRIST
jgi:hypothetical protein